MKRSALIGWLVVLLCPFVAMAQTDTIHLDAFEVSGERVPELLPGTVRNVEAIDRLEIQRLPVGDLHQLLLLTTGVDLRQRGVNGAQADLAIRGGSFEQSLVLLNGIRMNDPQTGHHSLDLPIEPGQIGRIEFLKGPGTRLYGANAFSGAVNFITPDEDRNILRIAGSAGDFGLFTGSLSATFHHKGSSHFVAASGMNCNGYTKNTDLTQWKAYYRGQFSLCSARLDFQAAYVEKDFGANSFYSVKYPDQFEQTRMEFISLKATGGGRIKWSPSLSWKRHHDRFELFRKDAPAWYAGHNYHMTDVVNASINLVFRGKIGKTTVGTEYRIEHIFSNVLGEVMAEPIPVPGETDAHFTRAAGRDLVSAFVDHQYKWKGLSVKGGLLLHYSTAFGSDIYPGAEAAWEFHAPCTLFVTANRALRLPTFTDLYYKGPMNIGNPDLKPEEAWEYEVGSRWRGKWLHASVGFYYRKAKHLIDWIRYQGETIWHSENLTRLNTYGPEVTLRFYPSLLRGKEFFITKIGLSYYMAQAKKPGGDFISYYILDQLKHSLSLDLTHRIWKGFYASWVTSLRNRAGAYTDPQSGLETAYRTYLLLDAKVGWDRGPANFFISVDNLLNADYRDFGAIPMPGRWLSVGFSFAIQ